MAPGGSAIGNAAGASCAYRFTGVWSRTMRCGTFVHVLLLSVLLTLPPLAHASPTDPTWIPGFYDDNDYDDVILFITGAVTAVDSTVVDPVGPVVICLGLIAPGTRQSAPAHPLESPSTRAPPSPLA
jgi:hypothetical protein